MTYKFTVPTTGIFEVTLPDGTFKTVTAPLESTLEELATL
jgi:hypothetical protein